MRRNEILKEDAFSEIILAGIGCLLFLPILVLVVVSITQTVGMR